MAPVGSEGVDPEGLDGDGGGMGAVLAAPASGLAETEPVGGAVAGAGPRALDTRLEQGGRITHTMLMIEAPWELASPSTILGIH